MMSISTPSRFRTFLTIGLDRTVGTQKYVSSLLARRGWHRVNQ